MLVWAGKRGRWPVLFIAVALLVGGCVSAGSNSTSSGQVGTFFVGPVNSQGDGGSAGAVWPMPGGATLVAAGGRGPYTWCDQTDCQAFAGPDPNDPTSTYAILGASSAGGPTVIDVSPDFLHDANDTVRMRVATLACTTQSCGQTGASVVAPPAFSQFADFRITASADGPHTVLVVDQQPTGSNPGPDAQWAMICQDPRCGKATVTPMHDPALAGNDGIVSANATGGFAVVSLDTDPADTNNPSATVYACAQPACPTPVTVGLSLLAGRGRLSTANLALRVAGDDVDLAVVSGNTIQLWTCAGCMTKTGTFTLDDTIAAPGPATAQSPSIAFGGNRLFAASAEPNSMNVVVASCDPAHCGNPNWRRIVTTSDPVVAVAVGTALGQNPRVEWTTQDHTNAVGGDTLNAHVLACDTPTCVH